MTTESKILFTSSRVVIGRFRCGPESRLWAEENAIGGSPLVAFPRTAVEIHQSGRSPFVATPNHAMLYNSHHLYRRGMIDPRGDACEFFSISPMLMSEALGPIEGVSSVDPQLPFIDSHSICTTNLFLAQRRLVRFAELSLVEDADGVDEWFFEILGSLLEQFVQRSGSDAKTTQAARDNRREKVEAVKEFISRKFRSSIGVQEIADYVDLSVFHLSRLFKQSTGYSLHRFLVEFRLRNSIERVLDGGDSLTTIALDLGFSSHSHFTNSFKRGFGIAPNQLRKTG